MNQSILQEKIELVNEVAQKLGDAASSVVVEYRGLSVAEVTELRRTLRAEDIDFKVYKNSIVRRAAEQAGYAGLTDVLVGPNAIAFGSDSVAPSRILVKFAKKHPKLVLKGGLVEKGVVDVETLTTLSALPNKEGMISMLLGCLQSPIRSFACVVKAVAEKQEAGSTIEEPKEVASEAAPEVAA
ncbi:MAG: 50S ribosomal protein L10 [Erysipelotrichaceae bacterium]|nr:50S ribosomal protein L10 [Erysipelotrichaceae bacterium]MDD3923730.1 50S ribosomal protein L10 [Erysipelotrichaceae bacterium]MDD4642646.1 50S ribosomal protein L10 [Erysipelotrichaceae bacterium]